MTEQTNPQAAYKAASPHPDLKSLEKLVGTWNLSGDTQGQITYEWMEGGFFLMQQVDFEHDGHRIKGLEIIRAGSKIHGSICLHRNIPRRQP